MKMNSPVFLGYDRAALDREYDNRAKVADFQGYLNRWEEESGETRSQFACELDLSYGPSAAETLDLFLPPKASEDGGASPLQVFFHGGYWRALSKNEFSYVARAFAPAGAMTAVVDYALMPIVTMDELIRQCRASVAWLYRNAATWGADRERIYISGHSAGGHIVAMMMSTDWTEFDSELPASLVKGGVGISGLYDLDPIQRCFLNGDLNLSDSAVQKNSPAILPDACRGPMLPAVGALEGPEYLRQSESLRRAWPTHCTRPWVLPQQHHFSIADQLRSPESELSIAIARQMGIR